MSEQQQTRGGFVGFMTTIPGILTAIAAIVTAAGGIYIGTQQNSSSATPSPAPSPLVVNLSMNGGAAPAPSGTVDQQSLRLSNASTEARNLTDSDRVQGLIDQCSQGDDFACATILEVLSQECSNGYGLSCDVLYELSPVGSVYQTFGATCGARLPTDYAGSCRTQ